LECKRLEHVPNLMNKRQDPYSRFPNCFIVLNSTSSRIGFWVRDTK
jgi:hypothetical protein